jgi:sucrose synthase
MYELIQSVLNSDEKIALRQLISNLSGSGKRYFLKNEILQAFAEFNRQTQKPAHFYHTSTLGKLIHYTHEIILEEESIWFLLRPWIASQQVWRLSADLLHWEAMSPQALLDARDRLVNRYQPQILEIDVSPFYEGIPTIDESRNIGQGLAFLHHHLCSQVSVDFPYWLESLFEFLQRHQYQGLSLLLNNRLPSGEQLVHQIKEALKFLGERPPAEPYEKFQFELQELGFEPGWGNTASRVRETLQLLERLIEKPDPAVLEAFFSRIPTIFNVALISIHGWVAQEGVLGRPETTGQVVYVLEQARSLAQQMEEVIRLAGLDRLGIQAKVIILTRLIPNCEGTWCNQRLEKLQGTDNSWILRVPFREFNPQVTQNWISKFEIWPYLESFAIDAERALLAEFRGSPDLLIGHYTDGNLVAFLLSLTLKVPHCNIAHSLEKTKYLFSDLYWQDLEEQYHFSAQYTADLIAMNGADFIITSSYQEILGTPETLGQYESYKCFTMPELYHVINGIELFSPKFNVVPPGVNEHIFFPYSQSSNRDPNLTEQVRDLLFTREDSQILGKLDDLNKRPLFALAPITSVKNLTGLAECFGKSEQLQTYCNLILLTSKIYPQEATNPEEEIEIKRLHELIDQYNLQGQIRWLGMRLPTLELAEAYRVIADCQGIFVHFARFEAFGQTILEAMISGLPTFATQFGGSLEIIENGDNGFHINPTNLEEAAGQIVAFIERCEENPQYWQDISQRAIERIRARYNWHSHAKQLLSIAKLYSFWNHVYHTNREATLRYWETLYYLLYKPRAEQILHKHLNQ